MRRVRGEVPGVRRSRRSARVHTDSATQPAAWRSLPPLPFGNSKALLDTDPKLLSSQVAQAMRTHVDYRPSGDPAHFAHRTLQVVTSPLRIVSSASSPVDVRIDGGSEPVLIVPTWGRFRAVVDGTTLEWQAGQSAALLPPLRSDGSDSLRAGLWFGIRPKALEALAATMLGHRAAGSDDGRPREPILRFDRPTLLAMRAGPSHFGNLFRSLCGALDEYLAMPWLIERSGIDDAFARTIVMLLAPHRFFDAEDDEAERRLFSAERLKEVCEFAMGNLDSRITLTDLEEFSGFSARALQYGFRRRFGCSPQRWLLDQRLEAVHAALRAAGPEATVTAVAGRYFTHLGRFARQYRDRYGESPSDTLARRRGAGLRG